MNVLYQKKVGGSADQKKINGTSAFNKDSAINLHTMDAGVMPTALTLIPSVDGNVLAMPISIKAYTAIRNTSYVTTGKRPARCAARFGSAVVKGTKTVTEL